MKLKFGKGFWGAFLLISSFGCARHSAEKNEFIAPTQAQQNNPAQNESREKVQLEAVKYLIETTKVNSKNICAKKQTLYFSRNELSKYALDNFPKKIGDCDTELIEERDLQDPKFDYHRFSRWYFGENFVVVTFSTRFWGGNDGGCNYVLEKVNGQWRNKSSDCFASAS